MGVDVRGITADSRAVRPGFMFAALAGREGRRAEQFIADAVARGAVAILAPEGTLMAARRAAAALADGPGAPDAAGENRG